MLCFTNSTHFGQSEHERFLAEEVFEGPVFVTDYPAAIKPFYMRQNNDNDKTNANANGNGNANDANGKTVACMDLLVPRVGEMIGGSMREERHDVLASAIEQHGLDTKSMQWYLDLRKYGTVPHGGWGLGFDRLLMFVTGLDNIRDVVPFPRAANAL